MATISTILVAQNLIERGYPFVESIQSMAPFSDEMIVVEGHSTDDTLVWLEKLQQRYPQIAIIQAQFDRSPHWLAQMRNTGLKACHGDYIWGADIDEVLGDDAGEHIRGTIRDLPDYEAFLYPHYHFIYDFNTIRANPGYVFGHHLFKNTGSVESIGEGTWKASPNQTVVEQPVVYHYGYVFANATRNKLANHKQLYPHWNMETVYGNRVVTRPFAGRHPASIEKLIARLQGKDYTPYLAEE